MNPLVSVVINNYNKKPYIEECLQSVFNQTYKEYEIIFWDDNSTDGSGDLVWDIRKMRSPISPFNFKILSTCSDAIPYEGIKLPLGVTRWLAVQECKGKYIAFLDSDDKWSNVKLERQVAFMESYSYLKLVFTNCYYFIHSHHYLNETFADRYPPNFRDPFLFLISKYNFVPMSSVMVDRLSLLEVMGESSHYTSGEDFDWWLKMLATYGTKCISNMGELYPYTHYRIVSDSLNHGSKQKIRAQWYEIDAVREAMSYKKLMRMEKLKVYLHMIRMYMELIYKEIKEKL